MDSDRAFRDAELVSLAAGKVTTRRSRAIELFGGPDGSTAVSGDRRVRLSEVHEEIPADESMEELPVSAACAAAIPMVHATSSLTGASGLPEELTAFFPNLGLQVVSTVVANISEAQPHYSREQLANACIDTLLEMSGDSNAVHDSDADFSFDHLNESIARLQGLNEVELLRCVKSLVVVLTLIDERPEHAHLRQLRKRSKMFANSVSGHRPALELLMLAGFEEMELDGEATLVFSGNPDTSLPFLRVKEALEQVYQSLASALRASSASAHSGRRQMSHQYRRSTYPVQTSQYPRLADTPAQAYPTGVVRVARTSSPQGVTEGRIRKRDRIKAFFTGGKATRSPATTPSAEVSGTSDTSAPEPSDAGHTMNIELLEVTSSGYVITSGSASPSGGDSNPQAQILRTTALSCREEAQEDLEDESLLGWSRSSGRRVTC